MEWLASHARGIGDALLYSALGFVVLLAAFYIVAAILPFSMRKEIEEDQNTSLGIILAAFIIGLSLIISSAIRG